MNPSLTKEQQEALDAQLGSGARLTDPRTNSTYVLVPEADFETVREVLEDERRQRAIRVIALRNAAGRMDEQP
jgi:hypothetical protein